MTNSFIQIPSHGTGVGGVGVRFAITDAGMSGTLYDDAFFYVEGTAEVSLSFVNLDSHVTTSWENSISGESDGSGAATRRLDRHSCQAERRAAEWTVSLSLRPTSNLRLDERRHLPIVVIVTP